MNLKNQKNGFSYLKLTFDEYKIIQSLLFTEKGNKIDGLWSIDSEPMTDIFILYGVSSVIDVLASLV